MIRIRINVKWILSTRAKDPDPLDSQDFGFLDLDPDPDQGAKYQHKTEERKMLHQICSIEKKDIIKFPDF